MMLGDIRLYTDIVLPESIRVVLLAFIVALIGSSCVENRPRHITITLDGLKTPETVPTVLPRPTSQPTLPNEPDKVPSLSAPAPTVVLATQTIPPVKATPNYAMVPTPTPIWVPPATVVIPSTSVLSEEIKVLLPPESFAQEMARLIFEHDVNPVKLFVAHVSLGEWADESLGCPSPGLFYESKDVPYSGFIYVLSDGENSWEYHAKSDDSLTVRCSEIEPIKGPRVNVSLVASLADVTAVILMHRNFTTDEFEKIKQMSEADLFRLAVVFDREIPLVIPTGCKTIFRLDFYTSGGVQPIEYLCAEDKNVVTGSQEFWEGMAGRAPIQIGEIIGPYLTGKPIPKLPEN